MLRFTAQGYSQKSVDAFSGALAKYQDVHAMLAVGPTTCLALGHPDAVRMRWAEARFYCAGCSEASAAPPGIELIELERVVKAALYFAQNLRLLFPVAPSVQVAHSDKAKTVRLTISAWKTDEDLAISESTP